MKKVLKSPREPSLLRKYRTDNPAALWRDFTSGRARKAQVQEQIKSDQGGLCAYCENGMTAGDFRVEHFHPKSGGPAEHNLSLDWNNLLGCCHGGSAPNTEDGYAGSGNLSCDVPKADRNLVGVILNPLVDIPAFPALFKCERSDGKLKADKGQCHEAGVNATQAEKSIEELRLNAPRLNRLRKETLDALNDNLRLYEEQGLSIRQSLEILAKKTFYKNEQGRWPRFFTGIRGYLGKEAENHLKSTGYNG